LAKEASLKEGKLVGFLGDTHIYTNHIRGLREQLARKPKRLPSIKTTNFTSIFDWKYTDSEVIGYEHHPRIRFEIAV
jgi:thymidylate synthase